MTKNADFKRLVRQRMARTGESFTTARAQLLARDGGPGPAEPAPDLAELAGMADDALQAKTGKSWAAWRDALDEAGARDLDHTAIASLIGERWPEIGAWWAQTVTVGYERIAGKRAVGEMPGGTFAAGKSKTVKRPLEALYRAFRDADWMRLAEVSTDRPGVVLRAGLPDGSRFAAYFTEKGPDKSSVSVQHTKLETAEDREAWKVIWGERLNTL